MAERVFHVLFGALAGGDFRFADFEQRTAFAFWGEDGERGDAGAGEGVEALDERLNALAEGLIKENGGAAAGFAIEERAFGDGDVEHFFETEGLGAKLDFVHVGGFGFAALVFDGAGAGAGVEFDDVGAAGDAVVEGADAEAAAGSDAVADFGGFGVGDFVEEVAFGGEAVFGPLLFEVDEGPLALAEG